MDEQMVRRVLGMLSDVGLVVCDVYFIEPHHPGLLDDNDYIIGRIEELGGFD